MSIISIIIPVYNSEETIRRCLDSVVGQSFTDWEAILVDDGSTDSSGIICDEYEKRDGRISVVHKENGGVSAARQVGLDKASGKYVIHVDSDDWVESDMLNEMYKKAEMDGADMLICDFYSDYGDKVYYKGQRPSSLDPKIVLNEMFDEIHGSCCNKLVRRECILKSKATFPEGVNYCEDVCFNVQLLKNDIIISYLCKAFYHYVQKATSLTNQFSEKTLKEGVRYVNFLESVLPSDSYPVIRAKELMKICAFRFSLLTTRELAQFYPEIRKVSSEKPLPALMYYFAFNGFDFLALLFRFFYLKLR